MFESMSFVLFVIVLALFGYASYLQAKLARIENSSKRADNRIARYRTRIAEWQHYADYLESELARYRTEYAGVRLDYDIARGKVKAAPVKSNGNGAKAYALTMPGMPVPTKAIFDQDGAIIDSSELAYPDDQERLKAWNHGKTIPTPKIRANGAKSADSDKSNANSAAKSEKTEKQAESSAKSSNGTKSTDNQVLNKTRDECKAQLKRDLTSDEESWLVTKVIDWELASKNSGNVTEYVRRAMGKFAPKTGKK